jgi:hypothetical protein
MLPTKTEAIVTIVVIHLRRMSQTVGTLFERIACAFDSERQTFPSSEFLPLVERAFQAS